MAARVQSQPRPGQVDLLTHHLGQLQVGRRKLYFPVFADQLIAEIRLPPLHRLPRNVIEINAMRTNQQQRIRLAVALRIVSATVHHVFSGGPQCRSQRIAGQRWPCEIGLAQHDALGLDHHGVGAAFDVDRAAMGLVGPFVGNDRVAMGTAFGQLLDVCQAAPGVGNRPLNLIELALQAADWRRAAQRSKIAPRCGRTELPQPIGKPPAMVFDVAQGEPGVGQLRLGGLPRGLQLLDPPLDHLMLGHEFVLLFGHLGRCLGGGLQLGLSRNGQQQQHERPHSANQYRQKGKQRHGWRCAVAMPALNEGDDVHAAWTALRAGSS